MKVLHLIGNLAGGGKERRMVQLLKGLQDIPGIIQCVVLFNDVIVYKEVWDTKIPIIILKSNNYRNQFRELSHLIRDFRPNIVHSWTDTNFALISLPILKSKYGFKYIAGYIGDAIPLPFFSANGCANLFSYVFSDAIVSNSYAGLVAKHAHNRKAHVIYNGFDFRRLDDNHTSNSISLPGNGNSIYITMVARVCPAKDFSSFLNLAKQSQLEGLNYYYLAVGEGPDLYYFTKQIQDNHLTNITFLGRREDVESIISQSKVCVLFSNSSKHLEGISNFIMEAMAAGKPVIATSGGGTNEIIENEINGFIIDSYDYHTCLSIIKRITSEAYTYDYISNNAKKRIKDQFSLAKMTNNYISLYNSIL